MKLSRTVTYALQATLQLAQSPLEGPIPCSKLAAQGNMPERFLLQILRSLVTHGILKSTRGVDGGYVLMKASTEVSMLDVIEAIDGPMEHQFEVCEGLPDASRQKLAKVLNEVDQLVHDKLASAKLSELVSGTQQRAPSARGSATIVTPLGADEPIVAPPSSVTSPSCSNKAESTKISRRQPGSPDAQSSAPPIPTMAPNEYGLSGSLSTFTPNSGTSI